MPWPEVKNQIRGRNLPRVTQTGENASLDWSPTKRRGRNCSVRGPFKSSKAEGLDWSELAKAPLTKPLSACHVPFLEVGRSELVCVGRNGAETIEWFGACASLGAEPVPTELPQSGLNGT